MFQQVKINTSLQNYLKFHHAIFILVTCEKKKVILKNVLLQLKTHYIECARMPQKSNSLAAKVTEVNEIGEKIIMGQVA